MAKAPRTVTVNGWTYNVDYIEWQLELDRARVAAGVADECAESRIAMWERTLRELNEISPPQPRSER